MSSVDIPTLLGGCLFVIAGIAMLVFRKRLAILLYSYGRDSGIRRLGSAWNSTLLPAVGVIIVGGMAIELSIFGNLS